MSKDSSSTWVRLAICLKDVGTWLAAWTAGGIKADPAQFALALITFLLVSIPSDIFLLNHEAHKIADRICADKEKKADSAG